MLRKLQEPWLPRMLDIGLEEDWLYVVRPYVPGIPLRQRLLRGPLDLPDALTLGRALFSALGQAHAHGVLHHDIRPVNLIVGDERPLQSVVLTDFSLGCHFSPDTLTAEEAIEAALYRSPEYAGSLDCDVGETSDLYSAGIVLFECLAGHAPFCGDSVGSILMQHVTSRAPN